jgi:peroxiredoxin
VVSRLYGVAYDIEMSGSKRTIARRVTYLIDGEGKVAHVWPKVDAAGNSTAVILRLRELLPELKR